MIALDTNILLRYLLNDSPAETAIAEKLLLGAERCVAPITVLLELVWVLETKKFPRPALATSIHLLCGLSNFSFDEPGIVASALHWYEQGMDFADGLHLAKSAHVSEFKTFDKSFAKSALRTGASQTVTIPT